jgi:hypothetical protein
MNSYKTFSSRCSPQIVQRQFDFSIAGKRYTAHGIKGANGEWALQVYSSGKWGFLGHAWKEKNGWKLITEEQIFVGKSLRQVIFFGFPEEES